MRINNRYNMRSLFVISRAACGLRKMILSLPFILTVMACSDSVVEDSYFVIEGVSLNDSYKELAIGDTARMTAVLHPFDLVWSESISWDDNVKQDIFWKSSNEKVAVVSENGVVTAVGKGTCKVHFICGSYKASCEITVRNTEISHLYGFWKYGNDSILIDYNNMVYVDGDRCKYTYDGMRLSIYHENESISISIISAGDSTISYRPMDSNDASSVLMKRAKYPLSVNDLYNGAISAKAQNDSTVAVIDMKLSDGTLWAVCNLGADRPDRNGLIVSWAETTEKKSYLLESYKWYDTKSLELTKYNGENNIDNFTLEPEDDAASVRLGSDWSIPSSDIVRTLLAECGLIPATLNGADGVLMVNRKEGINGPKLFFPSNCVYSGLGNQKIPMGLYWTSDYSNLNALNAFYMEISNRYSPYGLLGLSGKEKGMTIRPIHAPVR